MSLAVEPVSGYSRGGITRSDRPAGWEAARHKGQKWDSGTGRSITQRFSQVYILEGFGDGKVDFVSRRMS
jgi:hypothetical protein